VPQTTTEKLGPTRVKLTIAVTPDELKPSIDHAYSHIAEQVSIPGFRKGKVPPPIIDQRIGRGEVLNHAVAKVSTACSSRQWPKRESKPSAAPRRMSASGQTKKTSPATSL